VELKKSKKKLKKRIAEKVFRSILQELATNKNRSEGLFSECLCLVDYYKATPMLQKTNRK
jgi:hypothetical protein